MKKIIFLAIILTTNLTAQNNWFSLPTIWEVSGKGLAFNIESFDMNKDGKLDVVLGNWNDTYVYYGGQGILDTQKDITYKGRMLAICDYNGDGYNDMVALHFTGFDSTRYDYDGEILFYWGSSTGNIAIDTIGDHSIPLPTLYPTFEMFTVGSGKVGIQKGNLNNDGKTDLVFSSYNYNNSNGALYIYMGKESPTDTADYMLSGPYIRANLGSFVDIGNINGDQYDDLLISSNKSRSVGIAKDSINYLHIFYGSQNFTAILGEESEKYTSFVNPDDSTAAWFVRMFSVDDINGDGVDDIAISRSGYSKPLKTTIHYGNVNGIDTIPSFTFVQDTTTDLFFSAGGITQNIGDFNDDGYDDIIMAPSGWQIFTLHLCGPYVGNGNRYGAKGYSNGNGWFPEKAVNMGDQNNDGVNDIAVIAIAGYPDRNGYALMFYGQNIPTDIKQELFQPNEFNLSLNYPNPFNPSTIISWQLKERRFVTIKIFDSLGSEITTLVSEEKEAGFYKTEFDATKYKLSSGVYFCKLTTKGGQSASIKLIYLK
jgi:hypothetical protein